MIFKTLTLAIILQLLSGDSVSCSLCMELKRFMSSENPVQNSHGRLQVLDSIILKEDPIEFGPQDIYEVTTKEIIVLNPISAKVTSFDHNGVRTGFKVVSNVERMGNQSLITGGFPVNFTIDSDHLTIVKSGVNIIERHHRKDERVNVYDFSQQVGNLFIYPGQNMSFIQSREGEYLLFSPNMILSADRHTLVYEPENLVCFFLDPVEKTLNKIISISDILKSPMVNDFTFFKLQEYEGYIYAVKSNSLDLYVFDKLGNYLKTIEAPKELNNEVSRINRRMAGAGYGVSRIDMTNHGYTLFVRQPKALGNKCFLYQFSFKKGFEYRVSTPEGSELIGVRDNRFYFKCLRSVGGVAILVTRLKS